MNEYRKKWWPVSWFTIALVIILILVTLVRLRLSAMPFERDEGEYAYMGNLIIHGGVPYRDAYNMKLPGAFCMYALFIAAFGSSPVGVHIGFLVTSLITIILFYVAFRNLFSDMVAIVAVTIYSLMSVSMSFFGFVVHATHFINLFLAIALCLFAGFIKNRALLNAFLIGLMLGCAFLMKQQAVFLIFFAGIMIITTCLFAKPVNWKKTVAAALLYSAGVVLPYLVLLIIMLATGAFNKFWFWTVTYAHEYVHEYATDHRGMDSIIFPFSFLYHEFSIIWLLALLGLLLVWLSKYDLQRKIFVTLLALFSAASVLPGYYFRPHYFVVVIPAVGLLIGILLEFLSGLISTQRYRRVVDVLPFAAICLLCIPAIAGNWKYYFNEDLARINRKNYGDAPFMAAPAIGKYIEDHSAPQDKIAILGNEPEIFIYANRLSATGYVYVFPLIEQQKYNRQMQHEMISEIMAAPPKYILYDNFTWENLGQSLPHDILDWFATYIPAHYELMGLIEISKTPRYYWDDSANRSPSDDTFIKVFRLK